MVLNQIVGMVIRPPRASYNVDKHLLGPLITLKGVQCRRHDFQLSNSRGLILQCSHYKPVPRGEEKEQEREKGKEEQEREREREPPAEPLPCVIFCHTSSGCRADANVAVRLLIPLNIEVLALDFSGSGMSQGKHVTLGIFEVEDLNACIKYLRAEAESKRVGLWGTSMGAVVSLLYAGRDASLAGIVADSPFCSLKTLIVELVDFFKIPIPKFLVRMMLLPMMRRRIRRRADFDIYKLNLLDLAPTITVPALFAHAQGDQFVNPHHSADIYAAYGGPKKRVTFDGDHGTARPKAFFERVSAFFCEHLKPPPSLKKQESTLKMQRVQTWTSGAAQGGPAPARADTPAQQKQTGMLPAASAGRQVSMGAAAAAGGGVDQLGDREDNGSARSSEAGASSASEAGRGDPHFSAVAKVAEDFTQRMAEEDNKPHGTRPSTMPPQELHSEEQLEDDDLSEGSSRAESDTSSSRPMTPARATVADKLKRILLER